MNQDDKKDNKFKNVMIKYAVLICLIAQNTSLVLLIRYSRMDKTIKPYLLSTVVFLQEVLKLFICIVVIFFKTELSVAKFKEFINNDIIKRPKDFLKMGVPAFLFYLQNILVFFALGYINAATFQLLSQLKILTTAIISILILKTKIDLRKWISLILLVVGVWIIEFTKFRNNTSEKTSSMIGYVAVITVCCLSGFTVVYFEKILKSSTTDIWMRNVQLSLFSIVFAFVNIYIFDHEKVDEGGFYQGYNSIVIIIIFLSALGGLLIALVIAYADNIVKGYATSISIVISTFLSSYLLNDLNINQYFLLGASTVIGATILYAYNPNKPK